MMDQNKPGIATIGMFDGVHIGHRALIDELIGKAYETGSESTVFTFDRHPLSLIRPEAAPQLLMTLDERVKALRDAGVDNVVVMRFDQDLRRMTAREFMTHIRDRYGISALVMGYNHRFGSDVCDFDRFRLIGHDLGVRVYKAPEATIDGIGKPVSSSTVRSALADGDIALATRMLGRPYSLAGKVVEGRRIGRTIGFPTANVSPLDPGQLVPGNGVYAVKVRTDDGNVHDGMLNIGYRPTVSDDRAGELTIEVHIIDWQGDLYGRNVRLDFYGRLRAERRFASLDELKDCLSADRIEALRMLQ